MIIILYFIYRLHFNSFSCFRSTSDKNKSRSSHRDREDRPKDVKESSRDSKNPKEEKVETKEQKDDHYSAKDKTRKRRSTDHDSSGGDAKNLNVDSKDNNAPPLPATSNEEVPPTPSEPIDDKNSESNQQYVMLDKLLTEMEAPASSSQDLEKSGRIIKRTVMDQGVELQLICSEKVETPEKLEDPIIPPSDDLSNLSSDCLGFPEKSEKFTVDSEYTFLVMSHNIETSLVLPQIPAAILSAISLEESSHSNPEITQPQQSSFVPTSGKRIRKPNNNFMKDFYCNGEEIEVIDMKKIKYGDQVKPVNHRMSTAGEETSLDQSIVIVKKEEVVKVSDAPGMQFKMIKCILINFIKYLDSENTKNHLTDKINDLLCKTNAIEGTQRYSSGDLYKPRLFGSRNRRAAWKEESEENPPTEAVAPTNSVDTEENKTVAV